MLKWDWFDDFMVMKMMGEEEAKKAKEEEESRNFDPMPLAADKDDVIEEDEEDLDPTELLDSLQEKLFSLQDELYDLECNEPDDFSSEKYARWDEQRYRLEAKIFDIEVAMQNLG